VEAIAATGKPVIVFLFHAGPIDPARGGKSGAIFEMLYLGQETGTAVADVLFGSYNPAETAHLVPRSAGHLPAFYNYKPSARRAICSTMLPRFPFGFGLIIRLQHQQRSAVGSGGSRPPIGGSSG